MKVRICTYSYHGEKCQRPGTMSHGTKGEGPYYCPAHFHGEDKLRPIPAMTHWADAAIDERIKPDDYRQQGESKSEYRDRMMAKIKAGFTKIGKDLPYDKTRDLADDEERVAIQAE